MLWVWTVLANAIQKEPLRVSSIQYHVQDISLDVSLAAAQTHEGPFYLRREIVKRLLDARFLSFSSVPFSREISNGMMQYDETLTMEQRNDEPSDDLDLFLDAWISESTIRSGTGVTMNIPYKKRSTWSDIDLFRNKQDLEYLGYEVVSHRLREEEDPAYRQHNIWQSFNQLWFVRVIAPEEELAFLRDIAFDNKTTRSMYKNWYGILGDSIVPMYGGWICGSSTALFQWIMTNTALSVEWRAHSKRYADLYTASINGEVVATPWLDKTVYVPYVDLKIKNIADYPIILVMNKLGEREEVFTLARNEHKGSYQYVGSHINKSRQACYTRKINGEEEVSCYNNVYR